MISLAKVSGAAPQKICKRLNTKMRENRLTNETKVKVK
jgi:hypothetical protein